MGLVYDDPVMAVDALAHDALQVDVAALAVDLAVTQGPSAAAAAAAGRTSVLHRHPTHHTVTRTHSGDSRVAMPPRPSTRSTPKNTRSARCEHFILRNTLTKAIIDIQCSLSLFFVRSAAQRANVHRTFRLTVT